METTKLTKKLISIPSFVGNGCNEIKLAQFVAEYLQKKTKLKIEKQKVTDRRFNVIASNGWPVRQLIVGHLDTVQPQAGWQTDPLLPIVRQNRLYGLGASDQKGSIACLLKALEKIRSTNGLMVLFYIDEEYDFLGMKKFTKEYKEKIAPKLIFSTDGGNLSFGTGCRGLIEITFQIKGQSGHAANPQSGKNAIKGAAWAVEQLEKQLKKYLGQLLGQSSCNLAFLQGGLNQGLKNGKIILGREGNIIPDFAEFILDIRPANPQLTAKKVIELVEKNLKKQGLKLIKVAIRHDLGAWLTPKKQIKKVTNLVNQPKFTEPGKRGYIDIALLWETFGKVPCLSFGPGESSQAHQANEYVKIKNLYKAEKFYEKLLKNF